MHTLLLLLALWPSPCRSIESTYATIPVVANVDPIKHEAMHELSQEQLQTLITKMDECAATDTVTHEGDDYAFTVGLAAREHLAQMPHTSPTGITYDRPVPTGLQWFFYTVMGTLITFIWWKQFQYAFKQRNWRRRHS